MLRYPNSRLRVFNIFDLRVLAIVIVAAILVFNIHPLRFDFAAGSHRITPTAIDMDIWGNYKIYYKTSEFTHNKSEQFYYVEKDRQDLIDSISQVINNNQEMVVYYDKYIGWKGFTSPSTSPIVRIETIRTGFKSISYNVLSI